MPGLRYMLCKYKKTKVPKKTLYEAVMKWKTNKGN